MRAPVHSRCRSVILLTLVVILLMSSAESRAAGHSDDVGFFQAVIDGRKNAREAYERAKREELQEAAKASSERERTELARRSASQKSTYGRRPDTVGEEDAAKRGAEDAPQDLPWVSLLLGAAALGAFCILRLRARK